MTGRCQRNYQREAVFAGLRASGLTLAQIAAKFGVSRQMIHKVLRRADRDQSPLVDPEPPVS